MTVYARKTKRDRGRRSSRRNALTKMVSLDAAVLQLFHPDSDSHTGQLLEHLGQSNLAIGRIEGIRDKGRRDTETEKKRIGAAERHPESKARVFVGLTIDLIWRRLTSENSDGSGGSYGC
ncbi:hypothetical protein AWENTII_005886 [Aspergillus wentii]